MQTRKNSHTALSDLQVRRAFNISVGTGIALSILAIAFVLMSGNEPLGPSDVRFMAGAIAAASFLSAWLARRGRAVYGIYLILGTLYVSVLVAVLTYASAGAAAGVFTMVLTFVLTSAVMPPRHFRRLNAVAIGVTILSILLDAFELPFERIPSGNPAFTWGAAGVLVVVYGVLVIRQFKNYSMRTKLILVMVTITFTASIVLAFFSVSETTRIFTQTVGEQLATDADAHSRQLGNLLEEQINVLTTLSFNEVLQQAASEQIAAYGSLQSSEITAQVERLDQEWIAAGDNAPIIQEHLTNPAALDLREFQRGFDSYPEVFITDAYGALVAATQRTTDYNQSDEAWWQAAYADGDGGFYLSDVPEPDESVGDAYTIFFALPLRDRDTGELIGILRSTYLLTDIETLLATTRVGETGEADVIFLGDTPAHIREGHYEDIAPEEWMQLSTLVDKSYMQTEYEGIERMLGASWVKTIAGNSVVDDLNWLVIFHQDVTEARLPLEDQQRVTLLLSVFIIAAASTMSAGLAQILVVPITRLTEAAEKVGGGDLTARAVVESGDEIGRLATTFNGMTEQLQVTLQGLEERVANRTRALETATVVSRRISTTLDQRLLLNDVVEQVRNSFDYYHTHIYLYDEKKENLVMAGGTGEAGQLMLDHGHKVPRGHGLVGKAADINLPVLATDVSTYEGWLPNVLLPDTKSELAVPIAIGDNVVGVLDVQDNAINGLTQTDVDLLQAIAGQVAVALQNARAYQLAQHQADREALIGNIGQQIQSTTTIQDALKVAVRELGHALGTEVGVQLKRSDGRTLSKPLDESTRN